MVALPGYPPSLDGLEKALLGGHLGYEAVVQVAAARAASDERRVGFGGRHAASRCRAWRELVLFCVLRRLLRTAVPPVGEEYDSVHGPARASPKIQSRAAPAAGAAPQGRSSDLEGSREHAGAGRHGRRPRAAGHPVGPRQCRCFFRVQGVWKVFFLRCGGILDFCGQASLWAHAIAEGLAASSRRGAARGPGRCGCSHWHAPLFAAAAPAIQFTVHTREHVLSAVTSAWVLERTGWGCASYVMSVPGMLLGR
jgi:hypothetical protein